MSCGYGMGYRPARSPGAMTSWASRATRSGAVSIRPISTSRASRAAAGVRCGRRVVEVEASRSPPRDGWRRCCAHWRRIGSMLRAGAMKPSPARWATEIAAAPGAPFSGCATMTPPGATTKTARAIIRAGATYTPRSCSTMRQEHPQAHFRLAHAGHNPIVRGDGRSNGGTRQ